MNLVMWVIVGIVVNAFLLKDELLSQKDTIIAGIAIVIVRSITGGVISNYFFAGGIGSINLSTIALTGIAPILLLLSVRFYNSYEKNKTSESNVKNISEQFALN